MQKSNESSAAGAKPAGPSETPLGLASQVFEWTQRNVVPTQSGERRDFFDASTVTLERLECHVSTVKGGEASHPAHRHSDEEMVIVREGTLEVTINGKTQRAGPGSVIFYSSNDLHGMRNPGDAPAIYHVIRWAPRAPSERSAIGGKL